MVTTPEDDTTEKSVPVRGAILRASSDDTVPLFSDARAVPPRVTPFEPDLALSPDDWQTILCRHTVIPYARRNGVLVLAASTYADALRVVKALRNRTGPVSVTLASRSDILDALVRRYAAPLTRQATDALRDDAPDMSVATGFPSWMKFVLLATLLAFVSCLAMAPVTTLATLWIVFVPYLLATTALRAILIVRASRRREDQTPPRRTTPVVSILVPVYREADSLPALVDALTAFDYPVRALDIKILLEEDDAETVAEARRLTARSHIDCLVVPPSAPRTKPKSMNVALPFARGEIVGIFDAEDAPAPDQVSKAVATLEAAEPDVVCAQARLSYYNPQDNLLTRCVAMEYALWFDMLLTGMSRTRWPIPLGGTSLYFRTDALRTLGAWDPYNVTEDADLGLRLARAGKRAVVFDSTTLEEATGSVPAWIRQRSRWIKGFMLTWAVHMRAPRRLAQELGIMPMVAINILLLDGFLSFLLQPVLVLSGIVALAAGMAAWPAALDHPATGGVAAVLLAGQAMLIGAAFVAGRRRFGWRMALGAPLLLPYWMMGGVAALRALWQVPTRPQFWEKTVHCVSPVAKARRATVLGQAGDD